MKAPGLGSPWHTGMSTCGGLGLEKGLCQQPGGRRLVGEAWGKGGVFSASVFAPGTGGAALKQGVTDHGGPLPRSDMQDILQFLEVKDAGTVHQCL